MGAQILPSGSKLCQNLLCSDSKHRLTTGRAGSEARKTPGRACWALRPGGRYKTMRTNELRGFKRPYDADESEQNGIETIVADLQCRGWGGWDARDVLAGRLDDATVRQAVEVRR